MSSTEYQVSPAACRNKPPDKTAARSQLERDCVLLRVDARLDRTVEPSGASSRTSVDWYWPAPRNDNGTWIVFAPGPHIAARNHVLPFRRANSTSSPISEPVSTRVSSHVDGMLLMTSTAGTGQDALGIRRDGEQRAGEHDEACDLVRNARVAAALGEEHRRVVGGPGEVPCERQNGLMACALRASRSTPCRARFRARARWARCARGRSACSTRETPAGSGAPPPSGAAPRTGRSISLAS